MKSTEAIAIIGLLILGGAIGTAHADRDSLSAAGPSPWARLLPKQVQAGPQIGFTGSRFMASQDYHALIEPTPAKNDVGTALSLGAILTARWSHWFTLSLAPHRETYAMETRERTVAFPGNPFPHSLQASTKLSYNIWPVMMGIGWFTSRQHFQIQLGAYKAYLDQAEIQWTVDGEGYPNLPPLNYNETLTGWIVGSEYGLCLGSGDLLIGADTQGERQSMMTGMAGSIQAQSIRFHLGYVWNVWGRRGR